MNTIHPMVVHFPIALLIVGFMFATLAIFCKKCNEVDVCKPNCMQKVAYWLLALGAIGATAAVTSGALFTHSMEGARGELRDTHQMFAVMTMIVSLVTTVFYTYYVYRVPNDRKIEKIGYLLYVICVALVSITGHLGGEIVYSFK